MKKLVVISLALALLSASAVSQWCITCTVLPPCSGGIASLKESFCGSYDGVDRCWSYYKKLWACPTRPEDPIEYGNTYRTVERLGFACTSGSDCY